MFRCLNIYTLTFQTSVVTFDLLWSGVIFVFILCFPLLSCSVFFPSKNLCLFDYSSIAQNNPCLFFTHRFLSQFSPSAMWHLSSHAYSLRRLYRFRDSTVEARYRAVREAGTRGFIVLDASPFTSGEVVMIPPFNRQPFPPFFVFWKILSQRRNFMTLKKGNPTYSGNPTLQMSPFFYHVFTANCLFDVDFAIFQWLGKKHRRSSKNSKSLGRNIKLYKS